MSQKRKDVTYFNVTPATATWPVIEAQGFQLYCRGLHFSVPALSPSGRGMTIETVKPDTLLVKGLPGDDLELLKRHAEYGCLSLVCHTDGGALPFVFFPLRKRRGVIPVPAMQLGYCRSIEALRSLRRRDRTLSPAPRKSGCHRRCQRTDSSIARHL